VKTLFAWLEGSIEARPQDDERATYTKPVTKDDAALDWSLPAIDLWRRVRAYNPRPGARTWWKGDQLKVHAARPDTRWAGEGEPGQVVRTSSGVGVVTGEGALLLEEVQLASKRSMGTEDFARGQRDFVGSRLGERNEGACG
jgi:methionyl-tRNA formyltransferase